MIIFFISYFKLNSKILQDRILLSCRHTICESHLKETNMLIQNQIKYLECSQVFEVKDSDNEFKPNLELKPVLTGFIFLGDKQKRLKLSIEES